MTAPDFRHEPDTRTRLYAKEARCAHCLQQLVIAAGKLVRCCDEPVRGLGLHCFKCGRRAPGRCKCRRETPDGLTVVQMWIE